MPAPKVNQEGVSLITRFEGFRPKPYRDPVGVVTIGYGHTRTKIMPASVTEEEAVQLLVEDLGYFAEKVADLVEVPINENQYAALVSFTYNVGEKNLQRSTLLEKLNAGDYAGAAEEFQQWTKAGDRELKGLVRRRAAEEQLFRTPPAKQVVAQAMSPAEAAQMLVVLDPETQKPMLNPQFADATVVLAAPVARMLMPNKGVPSDEELQQEDVGPRDEGGGTVVTGDFA